MEKSGFSTQRETGIELQVDQTARLDLVLRLGSVSESVVVSADVPLLNTESGTRGDVIVTEEIVEMPLDGRSVTDLAFLVPGVTPSAQGGIGSGFNIAGTRGDNANFLVDGFNDRRSGLRADDVRAQTSTPFRNSRWRPVIIRRNMASSPEA